MEQTFVPMVESRSLVEIVQKQGCTNLRMYLSPADLQHDVQHGIYKISSSKISILPAYNNNDSLIGTGIPAQDIQNDPRVF
jgi:hypothetical protein